MILNNECVSHASYQSTIFTEYRLKHRYFGDAHI